ncbi:MAG: hypothetical protein WAP51_04790 [Candidatus Sungiibacteriota bacterium]
MDWSRAQDGKTVIKLSSWEEIGLRIILPQPKTRIQPEDIGLNLQKVPIEVVVAPIDGLEDEGGTVFSADVEPEYCEHGTLTSVSVRVSNWDASVDMSFLTFPIAQLDGHDDDEEEEEDD